MQYVLVGLPGYLTDWFCASLAASLRGRGRSVELCHVATLQQCAAAALRSEADDLVYLAHAVDRHLAAALAENPARCMVIRSDPAVALRTLLASGAPAPTEGFHAIMPAAQGAPIAALRRVMAGCATMTTLLDKGVSHEIVSADNAALTLGRVARRLGVPDGALAGVDAPDALGTVAGDPASEMTMALQGFVGGVADPDVPVVLKAGLFIDGAWPHGPVSGPIDVTGRARILFFGPYLCLPAGYWECDVFFDLSESALSGQYALDIIGHASGEMSELASLSFSLTAPGSQMARMAFRVPEHDVQVEFRIQSLRAMFDGFLTLDRVEVRRRRND